MILSIIIPAYNTADYIKSCIESCEIQDIDSNEYEIIIVNDGSTDNTLSILNELQSKYSNINILSQENQGQSVARNKGVLQAKGKYLWFIDSDDLISHNCIGKICRLMDKNHLEAFNTIPTTETKFQNDLSQKKLNIINTTSGEDFIIKNKPIIVAPWGYIFLTEFWRKNKFNFIPNIYYEDSQLIPIVISKCKKIAGFQRKDSISCYCYIVREGSTVNSQPNAKKINGYSVICNTHLEYSKKIQSLKLKEYFEASSSHAFIEGIKMIYRYKKDRIKTIIDFYESIPDLPQKIYAKSIIRKCEQYLILHNPILYCKIRQIIK